MTTEHKPQRERECVCGEINTRHCPVHGQDSKQHSSADEVRAVLDYLYHGTGAPGRSEQWQSGRFALQQLEEQLEAAEDYADEGWAWVGAALHALGVSHVFEIPDWRENLRKSIAQRNAEKAVAAAQYPASEPSDG